MSVERQDQFSYDMKNSARMGVTLKVSKLMLKRGVNRGIEIRRSVLFFGPNPSIHHYFRSNPDPHYVKSYCGVRLLQ